MGLHLYVERVCHPVTNLGPGRRVCVWMQGCARRCPGCLSPELFARQPAARMSVDAVARSIGRAADCDGLTISGGEPFDQAEALTTLLLEVRRTSALDVLVYTGYALEELRAGGGPRAGLLDLVDMLIDGPYLQDESNTLLWRGSDNQRLHLLSARAQAHASRVRETYGTRRDLHFATDREGRLVVIGIPERGFRREFEAATAKRGVPLDAKEGLS